MTTERKSKGYLCSLNTYGLSYSILLVFFTLCILLPRTVSAFAIPEKFVFDLTWTGVKAGTGTLEITNDKGSTKIVSTARSANWLSVFYTVDDRIESLLKNTQLPVLIGLPQNYRVKVREGIHRRDKEVMFDHENRQAAFIDYLKPEKKTFKISGNTHDPLSSFYYIRTLPFEVGKSLYVDIFDSNKLWNVEVLVLRKEKIKTKLGTFDTVVIKPLMQSEGIFNKKGDIYIWLTDDPRRLPVKMQTKVVVGSITAVLVDGAY